ncbi:hypothetical protein H5410_015661, partial [Solanum commersonii]
MPSNHGSIKEALAFFGGSNHTYSGSRGSGSGGPGTTGSTSRPKKSSNSHLFYDYYNWKGHTRNHCYQLHGYPSDWRGKKKISPGSTNTASFAAASFGPSSLSGRSPSCIPTGNLAPISHIGSSQILGGTEITN